jgi:hypothetical protein
MVQSLVLLRTAALDYVVIVRRRKRFEENLQRRTLGNVPLARLEKSIRIIVDPREP